MVNSGMACPDRVADPGIASVIFAPRHQNYTLSAISIHEQLADAISLGCLINAEESLTRKVLDNIRRKAFEHPAFLSAYFGELFSPSYATATLTLPTDIMYQEGKAVPSRKFPFVRHLDLLALPKTEGLFFDPDDVIET